jgi:hypothetical protein
MIPPFPFAFFDPTVGRLPFNSDLLLAAAFFVVPVTFFRLADCLAPPEAVRLPAPPLFVAVDVLEPPEREAVADFAAPAFDPAFLAVLADLEAPVLLVPELLEVALLFEPPVVDVADLLLP